MTARKRIGIHCSTQGGVWTAVERAVSYGANCAQIFSSSPRTWKSGTVRDVDAAKFAAARAKFDINPVVIHASFLINLCSHTASIRETSVGAFRAEMLQALALGVDGVVLHPGSWKNLTREQGLLFAAEGVEKAVEGLDFAGAPVRLLIENMPGAEFSLGSTLEQVGELQALLAGHLPVGVCLDTCHLHVAGYDLVTDAGYEDTVRQIEATVGCANVHVWHCNDAKAAMGSKLDRHEAIGEGTIGAAAFRRLLHDAQFAHAAFIAETPANEPGDEQRNVMALRALSAG